MTAWAFLKAIENHINTHEYSRDIYEILKVYYSKREACWLYSHNTNEYGVSDKKIGPLSANRLVEINDIFDHFNYTLGYLSGHTDVDFTAYSPIICTSYFLEDESLKEINVLPWLKQQKIKIDDLRRDPLIWNTVCPHLVKKETTTIHVHYTFGE